MLIGSYTRNISRETKLYFTHVPKTGGTSINTLFRNIFGALSCVEHAESLLIPLDTRENNSAFCRDHNFVSAHLPVDFYNVHFQPFGFKAIVTLRNPVEHFFSQVAHLSRSTHDLGNVELEETRKQIQIDAQAFFDRSTVERLDFFAGNQSKTIFGSDRMRLPKDVLTRVSYVLEKYDSIILSEDIIRLGDHIKLNGQALKIKVPEENVRDRNLFVDIELTDKIRELLNEDLIIYEEIKKINAISDPYWEQLVR